MKILLNAIDFANAVKWATKQMDSRDDTAFVGLVVKDGEGYLYHENHASYFNAPIQISSVSYSKDEDNEGKAEIALSGRHLQKVASIVGRNDDSCEIVIDAENKVELVCGENTFTLPVVERVLSEIPTVEEIGMVPEYELFTTAKSLGAICDMSAPGSLPMVENVTLTFYPDDDSPHMVLKSTDRFAMGEISLKYTPSKDGVFDTFKNVLKSEQEDAYNLFMPQSFATAFTPGKDPEILSMVFQDENSRFGYQFSDGRIALHSMTSISVPWETKDQKDRALKADRQFLYLDTKAITRAIQDIKTLSGQSEAISISHDKKDNGHVTVSDYMDRNSINVPLLDSRFTKGYEGKVWIPILPDVLVKSLSPVSTEEVELSFVTNKEPLVLRNSDGGVAYHDLFALSATVTMSNA